MLRGEIFWVNLEPSSPPEFGKIRPGLIVSNTEQNLYLPTVVIVPLSTRGEEIWPLRVSCSTKKTKPSFAVIPGIRQLSKARIIEKVGIAPLDILQNIDHALAEYLFD